MMYGSDYPFGGENNVKDTLACIKAMGIPQEDKKKILGENAKGLLKIK